MKTIYFLAGLLGLVATPVLAQMPNSAFQTAFDATSVVPQCSNKGFEAGLGDWTAFYGRISNGFSLGTLGGTVGPSCTSNGNGSGLECQIIETGGSDPNVSFLTRLIEGSQSIRLGGNSFSGNTRSNGKVADGLVKRFIVEPGKEIYNFQFAGVMDAAHDDDPNYSGNEPYFEAVAIDVSTGAIIDLISQPGSGFNSDVAPIPNDAGKRYFDWQCMSLDLTGYTGQEVAVFFVAGDCNHGGHTAYTYVDDTCSECAPKEQAFIDIDPLPAACTASGGKTVTGVFDVPAHENPSNIAITVEVRQASGIVASYPATLSGGTYTVDIPTADLEALGGCFDITAKLEFDFLTPSGLSGRRELETDIEGTEAGLDNDICAEELCDNPLSCLPVTPELSCGPNGVITAKLTGSTPAGFFTSFTEVLSQTSGVTATPGLISPLQSSPVITLDGAAPGMSVDLSITATEQGGGSAHGLDACCTLEITLDIPADICPIPEVEITKTCDSATITEGPAGPVGEVQCEITVTTNGVPFNGPLVITDMPTFGGSQNEPGYVTYLDGPDFNCSLGANPYCSSIPNPVVFPGNTSTIDVTLQLPTRGHLIETENCMRASNHSCSEEAVGAMCVFDPVNGGVPMTDEVCVPITPPPSDVKLQIIKEFVGCVPHPDDRPEDLCTYQLKVTNTDPVVPYNNGPAGLTVVDTMNVSNANSDIVFFNSATSNPAGVTCSPGAPLSSPTQTCTIPGLTLAPAATATIDMVYNVPSSRADYVIGNCANVPTENTIQGNDACEQITIPTNSTLPASFSVSAVKTCDDPVLGASSVPDEWIAQCKVTVTTTGVPAPGDIVEITDIPSLVSGGPNPVVVGNQYQGADGWACTMLAPLDTCTGLATDIAASSPSNIYFDVSVTAPLDGTVVRNCPEISVTDSNGALVSQSVGTCPDINFSPPPDDQDPVDITKTCEPAVPLANGAYGVDCQITLTSNGYPTTGAFFGDITVFDNLTQSTAPHATHKLSSRITSISGPGFVCDTPPGHDGVDLDCTRPAADLAPAGSTATIDVTMEFGADWNLRDNLENCTWAEIAGHFSTQEVCAAIPLPDPVLEDYELSKTCEPARVGYYALSDGWLVDCDLTMTMNTQGIGTVTMNDGAIIQSGSVATGTITNVTPPSADWMCIPNGLLLDCNVDAANLTPGTPYTTGVTLFFPFHGKPLDIVNCVDGSHTSGSQLIDQVCVPITADLPPELSVAKTCDAPRLESVNGTDTWLVDCTLDASWSDDLRFDDQLTVSDTASVLSGPGPISISDATAPRSWSNPIGPNQGDSIDFTASGGPLIGSTGGQFSVTLAIPPSGTATDAENCSAISMIRADGSTLAAPGNCVPISIPAQPGSGPVIDDVGDLAIAKSQIGSCDASGNCLFRIEVGNVGKTVMPVPQLQDSFVGAGVRSVTASDPTWSCFLPSTDVIACTSTPALTLDPDSSAQFDITVQVQNNPNGMENCAKFAWTPVPTKFDPKDLQERLNAAGFDVGRADGVIGPKTRAGIKAAHEANGLPPSTSLSGALANILGMPVPIQMEGDVEPKNDEMCIPVKGVPIHSRSKSFFDEFHQKYRSSEHVSGTSNVHTRAKSTADSHKRSKSFFDEFHKKYRSAEHVSGTSKAHTRASSSIDEHTRYNSSLDTFHLKYKSSEHEKATTKRRVIHDRGRSRMDEFHKRYKSEEHERTTTNRREIHEKKRSALDALHRRIKSEFHNRETSKPKIGIDLK